jgi:hypothetical protein
MGISVNSRTSGFRKWSEAHDPKIVNAPAAAAVIRCGIRNQERRTAVSLRKNQPLAAAGVPSKP